MLWLLTENSDAESEESIDSDMDLDAVFDVDKLTTEQTQALNQLSVIYGMKGDDYIKYVTTLMYQLNQREPSMKE